MFINLQHILLLAQLMAERVSDRGRERNRPDRT